MNLNDLKQTYLLKKSILNIIEDPSHEEHKTMLRNITIEQFEQIAVEVKELEDMGLHLITKTIN